jgi:hypothetical protein
MYLGAGAEVSPDSPVNFSHVALRIPESDLFAAKPAWGTGHCPVHHRTVLCTRLVLVLAYLAIPSLIIFLFSWLCL